MHQYYYAVASLPMLSYDMDTTPEIESFLRMCRQWLSKRDYAILENVSISDLAAKKPDNSALKRWRIWERALRNELTRLRAPKKKIEAEKYLRENPEVWGVDSVAREAYSQESPLAAEDLLNRARWNLFDQLEFGRHFEIEKLLVYHLRLQLLKRKAMLKKEEGTTRFQQAYDTITAALRE